MYFSILKFWICWIFFTNRKICYLWVGIGYMTWHGTIYPFRIKFTVLFFNYRQILPFCYSIAMLQLARYGLQYCKRSKMKNLFHIILSYSHHPNARLGQADRSVPGWDLRCTCWQPCWISLEWDQTRQSPPIRGIGRRIELRVRCPAQDGRGNCDVWKNSYNLSQELVWDHWRITNRHVIPLLFLAITSQTSATFQIVLSSATLSVRWHREII